MKPLLHTLWATDFDALTAKVESIGKFIAVLVATSTTLCSIGANYLPKYERFASPRVRTFWHGVTKVVALIAFNWRKHLPGMNWHIGAMSKSAELKETRKPAEVNTDEYES